MTRAVLPRCAHAVRWPLFALAALLAFPARAQAPSGAAGTITAAVPVGHLVRAQQTLDAARGAGVLWGDVLRTERGGRARIELSDGSLLNVGSESSLTVARHDPGAGQTWLELAYGRVRAKVTRLTRPSGRFEIRTPVAVSGVQGTEEFVEASASATLVIALGGGDVVVASADARISGEVLLHPGEATDVTGGRPPAPARPARLEEISRALAETAAAELLKLVPGTKIDAVLSSALDAKKNQLGDAVAATTTAPVKLAGAVALPKNAKLVGRVVEARARAKGRAESSLAILFESALLKDGRELALHAVVDTLAAPASPALEDEVQFAVPAVSGAPRASGSAGSGSRPGVGGVVANTTGAVAGAANTTVNAAGQTTASTTGGVAATAGATGSAGAPLQGVVRGLEGIQLAPLEATGTARVSSKSRNVHLDAGTRLTLRAVQ
jgi:hypothetical protein